MKKKRQLLKVVGESNAAILNNDGAYGENKSLSIFGKTSAAVNSENTLCQSP